MEEESTTVTSGAHRARLADVAYDEQYEPTMEHRFGIGSHCGSEELNMHTAYLEPRAATRAHYHLRSDIALYVLEGEGTLVTWDDEHRRCEQTVRKDDFWFCPRGVIHKFINHTDDTRFGLVAAYNHAGTGEATGKYYVEDPL